MLDTRLSEPVSLRDLFAAHALPAVWLGERRRIEEQELTESQAWYAAPEVWLESVKGVDGPMFRERVAKAAFDMADVMLAERMKSLGPVEALARKLAAR